MGNTMLIWAVVIILVCGTSLSLIVSEFDVDVMEIDNPLILGMVSINHFLWTPLIILTTEQTQPPTFWEILNPFYTATVNEENINFITGMVLFIDNALYGFGLLPDILIYLIFIVLTVMIIKGIASILT